jgi:hypothetical protein
MKFFIYERFFIDYIFVYIDYGFLILKRRNYMPAKDIYHDHVKEALEKDGWTITDDPYKLEYGKKYV